MIAGLILAGGRSSRFEGDKSAALLAGRTLAEWVCRRALPQVDRLLLNARVPPPGGALADLPLVTDVDDDFKGPMAGVYAGMQWLRDHLPNYGWLATFPVDSPFFPPDHVSRLLAAASSGSRPAIARSYGRAHPVFALWPTSILPELAANLSHGRRWALMAFAEAAGAVVVDVPAAGFDPYFNVNTRADLADAKRIAQTFFGRAL